MTLHKVPGYQRIFLILRGKIMDGTYGPGDRVPSEAELSKQFDVSRITSRRALAELEQEGLVDRERGRGTLVRKVFPLAANFDGTLNSLEESNRVIGQTSVRVTAYTLCEMAPRLREIFGGKKTRAFRLERIRLIDKQPFCRVTTYLPESIGRMLSPVQLEQDTLTNLLKKNGIKIGNAKQTVSATIADPATANQLQIAVGSPLLRIDRTVRGTGGNVVEFFTALFRPDLFQLSMSLANDAAVKTHSPAWKETSPIRISA